MSRAALLHLPCLQQNQIALPANVGAALAIKPASVVPADDGLLDLFAIVSNLLLCGYPQRGQGVMIKQFELGSVVLRIKVKGFGRHHFGLGHPSLLVFGLRRDRSKRTPGILEWNTSHRSRHWAD